jgi:diguanylate cyclase (GGDEF)-like protein/PAS domain S-box-containing protein
MSASGHVPSGFWDADIERRLRLALVALDNAHDTLLIHDADGNLVYFNDPAARNLGYTSEEFSRLGPWGFAGGESRRSIAKRIDAVKREGSLRFLSTRVTADGQRRIYEVESRYLESEDGPLFVSASHDVTERVRANEILQHLAFHDPLTGLANRALFDDRLEQALIGARRHGHTAGIVYIDVDDFKTINDTYGHSFGDEVLIAVGERLIAGVREEDTVARLGGDEFVVIFPRMRTADELRSIAENLRRHLAEPLLVGGSVFALSVSEGLAVFDADTDDARSMIMRADIEMYQAKRTRAMGRTRR